MLSAAPAPVVTGKPTRRAGLKGPTLRPDPNTSVTAGVRVVKGKESYIIDFQYKFITRRTFFIILEHLYSVERILVANYVKCIIVDLTLYIITDVIYSKVCHDSPKINFITN